MILGAFWIRVKWNWSRDKKFLKQIEDGKHDGFDQSQPWRFTKRGIIFSHDSLLETVNILETCLISSWTSNNSELAERVVEFADFAKEHFLDESQNTLQKLNDLSIKEKSLFLEKILLEMSKKSKHFKESDCKLKQFRDLVVTKQSLLYSILKLRTSSF